MEIQVHGKKMQVSETINQLVVQKLEGAGHFWDGKVGIIDVELSEEPNPRQSADRFRVEITAPVAGHTIRVHSTSHDQHAAVDSAADKFERQLRRLKERIISRSRNNNKRLNQTPPEAEVDDELPPSASIVRTKQFAMKPMSPEEAALQLEMLGHSFFFFFNAETDGHAVLYRRRDGQLGLIESK
jgi:putative sigma-54 modulation protein